MAYTSVLEELPGNLKPQKFTIENFLGDAPWALLSCGLNAVGGATAGFLDREFTDWQPNWAAFPTFGNALVAIVLKMAFPDQVPLHNVMREVASGIAGWCGDDVVYGLYNWIARPRWVAGKSYSKGSKVRYKGVVWEASADIGANIGGAPPAEPGKDGRWKDTGARAQGFRLAEIQQYAQAFVQDPRRVDAISEDVSERLAERGLVEDKETFKREMRSTMNEVIAQFAE